MHETRIFGVILQIFSGACPGPPYNGLAFRTFHKVDLWRHSGTKLWVPFENFLHTLLGADIDFDWKLALISNSCFSLALSSHHLR